MSLQELKQALREASITYGFNETLRKLRSGSVKKIFLAKNCPDEMRNDLTHYAKLAHAELLALNETNDELSLICKKNYPLSVISC